MRTFLTLLPGASRNSLLIFHTFLIISSRSLSVSFFSSFHSNFRVSRRLAPFSSGSSKSSLYLELFDSLLLGVSALLCCDFSLGVSALLYWGRSLFFGVSFTYIFLNCSDLELFGFRFGFLQHCCIGCLTVTRFFGCSWLIPLLDLLLFSVFGLYIRHPLRALYEARWVVSCAIGALGLEIFLSFILAIFCVMCFGTVHELYFDLAVFLSMSVFLALMVLGNVSFSGIILPSYSHVL